MRMCSTVAHSRLATEAGKQEMTVPRSPRKRKVLANVSNHKTLEIEVGDGRVCQGNKPAICGEKHEF